MRSLALVLVTVGVCVAQLAGASPWTANSLPDPQKNFDECGRSVKGFLCSPDGLVNDKALDVVQGQINAIYDGTDPYAKLFCPAAGKYVEVQVLATVVGKVDGSGEASKRVQQFSKGLHDRFGVGASKECGSGVVIAISVEDRQVYISTGALVKKLLPAFTIESLVHGIKPDLRAEKYGEALESLIVQVGLVLASDCAKNGNCYEHEEKEGIDWWLALVLAVFVLLGVGQFWWGRREARVRGEVAEKLRKLQKDLKASKQGKYVSTSCPICLEDFSPYDGPSTASSTTTTTTTTTTAASDSELAFLRPAADNKDPAASIQKEHARSSTLEEPEENAPLLSEHGPCSTKDKAGATPSKAAKGGGSSSSKGRNEADPPKLPFMLPCGHSFCEPCIIDWIKKKPHCPVCRKSASGDDTGATQTSSRNSPGASTSQQGGCPPVLRLRPPRGGSCHAGGMGYGGMGYDGFGPELAYRLHRMRQRHRSHLSQEVIDDLMWEANGDVGRRPGSRRGPAEDWGSHPEFLRQMDEAIRESRASSGSMGSGGRSFGGGGSGGGGGGGGGW